ncbi:MAG: lytic transglycosylase domain-containing protein, partial [Thiobacillus sp.]
NPNAVSQQGATGLMQIMPANYKALGITNPNDPAQSINGAAKLLAQNLKASGGDLQQAITMYHGGTNPANYGPKTQNYEAKVMAGYNQGKMPSFEDMDAKYGGGNATQASAPAAQGMPSFDDMDAKYGQSPTAVAPPTTLQSVGRGLLQGVHDVIDYPAEKLAQLGDSTGLTNLIGAPNAQQTSQSDSGYRNQFNQQYGGNLPAQVGRVGGEIAASAPVLAGGGALGDGVLGGAADAIGGTGGNAINGIRNLLTGSAGQGESGITGWATRRASGAAQGALAGGAAGALTAPAFTDNGNAEHQARFGAAIGAGVNGLVSPVVGALATPVIKGAGAILSRIGDVSPAATNIGAVNALSKAFANDGMTLQEGLHAMGSLGDGATLADVGGRNVSGLSQVVANTPGEGQQTAAYLLDRADQSPDTVTKALQTATGQSGNISSTMDDLMAQRRQAAQPLYEKAFSNPVTVDNRLQQFLDDPDIQSAMKTGVPLARRQAIADGVPFDLTSYTGRDPQSIKNPTILDAHGNEIGQTSATSQIPPNMQALDAAKQGLDSMLESSDNRDPMTGSLNAQGRSLNNLRSAFLDHLDTLNPDYAAARNAWAGPSQAMQAMKEGTNFLKSDPDEIASTLSSMPDSNVPFYLNGITSAVQNKVDSTPDGANVVRKIFGTPAIRAKLEAAFNNPDAYDKFAQQMANQAQFANTKNAVLSGSQTYQRLANAAAQETDYSSHLLNAVTGNPVGGLIGGAKAAISNYLAPSSNQLAAQGRMLFNPDAQAVQQMIDKAQPGIVRRGISNALTASKPALNLSLPLGLEYNVQRHPADTYSIHPASAP